MARLADLQRQIDEATEEVCHLVQEGLFNEDAWYDDLNHDAFTFDDASPLAAELQAIPWPPSYKPPQLPMYDGGQGVVCSSVDRVEASSKAKFP